MLRSHSRPRFRPGCHETLSNGKGATGHSDKGYSVETNTVLFEGALSAPASAAADMRANSSSVGAVVMDSTPLTPHPPPPPNLTPKQDAPPPQNPFVLAAAILFSVVLCVSLAGIWAVQLYVGWYVLSTLAQQGRLGIQESLCFC